MQVSTAYVNGRRVGYTPEEPFTPNRSIAEEQQGAAAPKLDVDYEIELALGAPAKYREEAAALGLGEGEASSYVSKKVSELGMERARMHGWQDTYVFTKAMGEMIIVRDRADLGVAIMRPAIVEGAAHEPAKGWIEGLRMADPIIISYGKGQLKGFCGDTNGVLDIVPVDLVVNACLGAMAAAAKRKTDEVAVYHVATSVANPLTNRMFVNLVNEHFKEQPMLDRQDEPIRLGQRMYIFPSVVSFMVTSWLRYMLPMKLVELKRRLLAFLPFLPAAEVSKESRKQALINSKTYEQLEHFADIYSPYTFYKGRFGASNTMELHRSLSEEEQAKFNFNLQSVDWRAYLCDVHIPGLRKFVLKGRGT